MNTKLSMSVGGLRPPNPPRISLRSIGAGFVVSCAALAGLVAARANAARPDATGSVPAREGARPALAPPPAKPVVERTADAVPADVTAVVTRERDGTRVAVRRPGTVVALRLAGVRAAGLDEASLLVQGAAQGGPELVWESTDRTTL